MRARWLALLVSPLGCLDPMGPSHHDPSTPQQTSAAPVTITTVGDYRVLVHWNARPIPCPTQSQGIFPIESLQAMDRWYGNQLRAAGERSLCADANAGNEVYRLAWIPSFHHTVIIRIERRGGDHSFNAVQLSGAGGYEPGTPQEQITVAISESEWKSWLALIARARFWEAQTIAADTIFDSTGARVGFVGVDGAQWILEAKRFTDYHAVDRWSPLSTGPDGAFRAACSWLLHRSGLVPDTLIAEY